MDIVIRDENTSPLIDENEEKNEVFSTDRMLSIIDKNTNFVQNQLIFAFLICYILVFIPSLFPIFEISTQFYCTNNEGSLLSNCSFKQYCIGYFPYKSNYNKNSEFKKNIHYNMKDTQYKTWINQLNLLCEDTYFFSYCIFFYFTAMIISILMTVKVINEFERKSVILSFLKLIIFAQLIMVIFPGSFTIAFSCFIFGICNSVIGCFLFVLIYENLKTRCSYIQIMIPLSAVLQIVLFYLIKNWEKLCLLNIAVSLIVIYFFDYFIESFEFLHVNRKYKNIKNIIEDETVGFNSDLIQNYLKKVKFSYLLEEEKVYNDKKKYQKNMTKYKLEKIDEEENDYKDLVCNNTNLLSIYNDPKVFTNRKLNECDKIDNNEDDNYKDKNKDLNSNEPKNKNNKNVLEGENNKEIMNNDKNIDKESTNNVEIINNYNEDLIGKIDFLKTIDYSEFEDDILTDSKHKSKKENLKKVSKLDYLDYQTDYSFYQYTNSSFYFNAKNSQYQVISFILGTVLDSNLKNKKRIFAFLNLYIWISNGITFYYFLFFIPSFVYEANNIIFYCLLIFISEIFARITCYLYLSLFKSRTIILFSTLISGILLVILYMVTLDTKNIFTPREFYVKACLIFMIKYMSSINNICNYIHTIEVFPIEQRLSTIFTLGIFFNFGACLSGFIVKIGIKSIIILGINSILIAIMLSLFFKKL